MTDKKFLQTVYDLSTPQQARDLYNNWAATYDDEIRENGYVTPHRIADALARHLTDKEAAILDFGCGTGLSGVALKSAGFQVFDGADLSADMLKGAQAKGIYRSLWQVDPGADVPTGYAAVTAMGVIGNGAAPLSVFDTLLNSLATGGLFALSFNDNTLAEPKYEAHLRGSIDSGATRLLFQEYGPHLPGINLKANVYILEKL